MQINVKKAKLWVRIRRVHAAVHYGELVKCVVLGEHNLQVVSTAPVLRIWKVVLSPSVTGLYGGTRL